MLILFTADLHLKHRHGYSLMVKDRIWDVLFEEKMKVLDQIPIVAEKFKVDHVAITGDVFDTTNPPEPIKAEFCKWLFKFKEIPVTIIPGNHESVSSSNNALMDIGTAFHSGEGINIMNEGKLWIDGDIGMFHCMMEGIDIRYKKSVLYSDDRFADFKLILLGDYHSFYQRKYADKTFIYPGAPYPTRFGETNHSVCLIDYDEGDTTINSIKKVNLKSYTMEEISIDCHDIDKHYSIISDFVDKCKSNRLILKCGIIGDKENYKEIVQTMNKCKLEVMNNDKIIDFIYNIKVDEKDLNRVNIENKTIQEVTTDYIDKNCKYPDRAKKLLHEAAEGLLTI